MLDEDARTAKTPGALITALRGHQELLRKPAADTRPYMDVLLLASEHNVRGDALCLCDPASPPSLLTWAKEALHKDAEYATRCLSEILPAVPVKMWSPLRVMGLLEEMLVHWPRTLPALVSAVKADDANAVALVETHGILDKIAVEGETEATRKLMRVLNEAH